MMMRLGDRCGQQLAFAATGDRDLWVLDGDLADSDGAVHFAQRHPDRFLMAGIAEQNMVSVAAGMAAAGRRPWVFSFAAFLCFRAYDQIRVCVSQAAQPVVLVGSHAGGLAGRNGKTHCALNDLALMLSLPRLQVWSPGDFRDVDFVVSTLTQVRAPAYVRLPRSMLDEQRGQLPGNAAPYRVLRELRPITLISTGIASHWALEAAQLLAADGIDVGLIHCLCLTAKLPLSALLADAERVFVIEDHYTFGGLATLVRQQAIAAPIEAFGWPADWTGKSGDEDGLRAAHDLSGAALARAIRARVLRGALPFDAQLDAREHGRTEERCYPSS